MEREFFNKQMFRLKEIYNTKYKDSYPQERCNILFAKFQAVSNEEFKRCVSYLIATQKFAPLFKEFNDFLAPSLRENQSQNNAKKEAEMPNCSRCNNTGTVHITKEKDCVITGHKSNYVYGYRCLLCPRGNMYNSKSILGDPEVFNERNSN